MFFSSLLGASKGNLVEADGGFWRGMLGRNSNSSRVVVTPETALGLPILQNCVTLLAETIGQLPLELYQRKGEGQREPAVNHPLYDVLRYQPNGFQTPYELRECEQMSAGLRGNSYTLMERRDDGNVTALWPLCYEKVVVYKGADLLPCYQVGNYAERLPMRMVHHVRWHSLNHYTGLSPIELHAESIGLAQAVRQYTGKSFANGTSVSGVIERPGEAPAIKDQGSIDRIVDQWGEKYSGMDNAKKVALLQEGMTFKPISMTNVDADIINILNASGTDVARIYKIPLPMVNDLSKANYNTTEQLLIQFVVFGLLPWVKRHEQSMMRDFLLPADRRGYFIEFNLSGLLRGDQKSRYEAYAIGRQWGWLSVNDIRRLENMPPVSGGDIYLQPLNMVDAGKGIPDLNNPNVRAQLELQQREIERTLSQ
ncbi:HK97 family phage portal protein [Pseudomonas aeruginosa BWH035]|uniref:phage portal protein n=1 Tax=Pseudomonas aeruginosa TaxID=287 RepID=UPI000450FB28|nr:phage portal protein [Pseudomonas aeruginosa]EZN60133.1 HK97 family phage portal protein [Pseudomonas aeruginosa BWH035]HEJ3453694.1 phage portal protein [Pseudomonas aeruginosa]HEJ4026175.1 phage portal protein [Pseudomonas aeruginosa]